MSKRQSLYELRVRVLNGLPAMAILYNHAGGEAEWELCWANGRPLPQSILTRIGESEIFSIESLLLSEYHDYRLGEAADSKRDYQMTRDV